MSDLFHFKSLKQLEVDIFNNSLPWNKLLLAWRTQVNILQIYLKPWIKINNFRGKNRAQNQKKWRLVNPLASYPRICLPPWPIWNWLRSIQGGQKHCSQFRGFVQICGEYARICVWSCSICCPSSPHRPIHKGTHKGGRREAPPSLWTGVGNPLRIWVD